MSGANSAKSLRGEREVHDAFDGAGWSVRGLESSGDWLAFRGDRAAHVEVKRQERLDVPKWLRQAQAEAPEGVPALVTFRQNRGEWYAALRLDDLLRLIG